MPPPLGLPPRLGPLRSLVTVFLRALPCWIDFSRAARSVRLQPLAAAWRVPLSVASEGPGPEGAEAPVVVEGAS